MSSQTLRERAAPDRKCRPLEIALPRRDTSGTEPFSLLSPYQRLYREAEVCPAMGFPGFCKMLVKSVSIIAELRYGESEK